tara:strand:- start:159 stop:563 length:405 start_codon:yes stop_codon:yes gene_type:complete
MQTREYKVSLIGPSEVGKSSFLKRLLYGYNHIYVTEKTLGVDVIPIDIHNNNDKIRLNIWDCAGDENYRGLKDKYHIDTQAAIIFRNSNKGNNYNYENELPENIPKFYVDNYNLQNPEHTVEEYKTMLYNMINN